MPGLGRSASGQPIGTGVRRIPQPGGENAQQASSVYHDVYGELPVPATAYVTSVTRLQSLEVTPSVRTTMSNASVVQRANRRNGMISTGGYQLNEVTTPPVYEPVDSSKFQDWLVGPQVNWSGNAALHEAGYPAATISFGTMRNMAWSERVPQLPTRTSGGPGPATMRQAPRFKAVQTVPRYSTMPPTFPTASAPG